jgi:hypothetical protein
MTPKLHKAMLRAAKSIVELSTFHQGLLDNATQDREAMQKLTHDSSNEEVAKALGFPADKAVQLDIMRAQQERMMEEFASDPELRPHMQPWMVDFEGKEQPPTAGRNDITVDDLETEIHADYGELPRVVRDWLESHGFHITDTGSGTTGWQLGVPCSDQEEERLCRLAYRELVTYIEAGVLTIRIHFWGWRFQGIYNDPAAETFLATQAAS